MVLIGTRKDLLEDWKYMQQMKERGETPVAYNEGMQVACRSGCISYIETSAVKELNCSTMEQTVLKLITLIEERNEQKEKKCTLQ